jgi:hypothetical protein
MKTGIIQKTQKEITKILDELRDEFPSSTYHIMQRNCNHFSEAVCKKFGFVFPSKHNLCVAFALIFNVKTLTHTHTHTHTHIHT